MSWWKDRIFEIGARYLTQPRAAYSRRARLDPLALRSSLRPGDVILVEGDQRVSEVIQFLTRSSWSHAAIYVGDTFSACAHPERERHEKVHGKEADHMLVEAVLGEGVIAAPLSKYVGCNLRICRPIGLRDDDRDRVLAAVIEQLGTRYDVRQVLELARYFFPVTLIPARFRRAALESTSRLTREVICSSLIGGAFQGVGFPILPSALRSGRERPPALGDRGQDGGDVFRHKRTDLITPRDFDLSPWFEIVKLTHVGEEPFDYRRIRWA